MIIKRIGVMSLAKLMAVTYAAIGLIFGGFVALFGLLGGGAMMAAGADDAGMGSGIMAGMGLLAVIILPIFYGVLGFIGGGKLFAFNRLHQCVEGRVELCLRSVALFARHLTFLLSFEDHTPCVKIFALER